MGNSKTSTRYLVSVILSIIATGINYLITLLLTNYITENIGVEANGFVSLAKTFAGYALIFSVALNSFASRFISVAYHKGEIEKANKYYNSIFIADIILALALLAVFSFIIIFLENLIIIPANLVLDVKILFLLDIISFCISSCSTVFLCACVIKNRLDLSNLVKLISYILEAVFLFLAFKLFSPRIFYVGIGMIISSVFIMLVDIILTIKLIPELKFSKKDISKKTIKEVAIPGVWNSINMLGNTLNTGLDLVVSNLLLSTIKTGLLSIVKSISTIFSSLFQLVSIPFQPLQIKYYSEGNKIKLIDSFKYGIKFNGFLSNILFAGFAVFGVVYFKLWVPSQDSYLLQSICLVTILGTIIEGAVYPLFYAYTLTLKNKFPCVITIISGLINVVGMYVLIKYFNADLYGVVGTTTVLTWLVNFIFNPIYSSKCLGIKKSTFYPCLIRHILSAVLITGAFYLISRFYFPSSWLGLVTIAFIGTILGAVIHFAMVFEKKDWNFILSIFKKKKNE